MTDVLVNGPGDVWVDNEARGSEKRVPVELVIGPPGAGARRPAGRARRAAPRRCLPHRGRPPARRHTPARRPGTARRNGRRGLATGPAAPARSRSKSLWPGGALPDQWAGLLRSLVSARRANVLVSGGTGTGKTTLLAALLSLVPDPDERMVTVEEARELRPAHPHVVHLAARPRQRRGRGGGGPLADLVRNALRMRPDRIVLGEMPWRRGA